MTAAEAIAITEANTVVSKALMSAIFTSIEKHAKEGKYSATLFIGDNHHVQTARELTKLGYVVSHITQAAAGGGQKYVKSEIRW
jgi:UDP-N-acetylglucosamine transferase subunit ALG13